MGHSFCSEAGQAREGNDNGPRKREDETGTTRGRSLEDLAAGPPKPNPREDQTRYTTTTTTTTTTIIIIIIIIIIIAIMTRKKVLCRPNF